MLLLPLLALAAAWSHRSMDCIAKSIPDFQYAYIHWYRHIPAKAPEWILFIGASTVSYDDNSYSNKYSSKKGLICTGNMLLLPVLLATSFWSFGPCVDMQSVPVQTPKMQNQMKGTSASMSCELGEKTIVHWYRQLPGQPPKRILYESGGTPVFEDSNDGSRFRVRTDPTQPKYDLEIYSLTPRDSGMYYCAYWYQVPQH